MKKLEIIIITVFAIIFLLLALMVGVEIGKSFINKEIINNNIHISENLTNLSNTQNTTVFDNKNEQNEEIVSIAYYKKYNDEYIYKVPKINIDNSNVKKINDEIMEYCMEFINKSEEYAKHAKILTSEGYEEPSFEYYIDYEYYINNMREYEVNEHRIVNVKLEKKCLSLVIYVTHYAGFRMHKTFNIDINTGNTISNEELILSNFPYDDGEMFEKILREYYTTIVKLNFYTIIPTDPLASQYMDKSIEASIAQENCNRELPMFLDENGILCVCSLVYGWAGSR